MLELVKVLEQFQTPGNIIALAAFLVLIIAAFKFNISYNLNDHFEARRKEKEEKKIKTLQSLCPHVSVQYDSKWPVIQSLFWRDREDTAVWPHWTCDQCGLRILSAKHLGRLEESWADNPEGVQAQQEKYEKTRARLYKV